MDVNLFDQLSYFNDYKFFALNHSYTYKDSSVQQSVTQFVDKYIEPFDEAKWLPKKAKERKITEQELKSEWELKAEISTTTGTHFHKFMEESLSGKEFILRDADVKDYLREDVFSRYNVLINQGAKFIQDTRSTLFPVKTEFIVGYEDKIAGQIDALVYNKVSKSLEIYDWKTNKDIRCWNIWHNRMLPPFNNLEECELNTYSLQLSTYKSLLQKQGVPVGGLNIVWFNEKNKSYQVFPCKDLSNMVCDLLF